MKVNKQSLKKSYDAPAWLLVLVFIFAIGVAVVAVKSVSKMKMADMAQNSAMKQANTPIIPLSPMSTIDWNNIQWVHYASPDKKLFFEYPQGLRLDPSYTSANNYEGVSITDMAINKDGLFTSDDYLEPDIVIDNPIGESSYAVYKGLLIQIHIGMPDENTDTWNTLHGFHIYQQDNTYQGKQNKVRFLSSTLINSNVKFYITATFSNDNNYYYTVYQQILDTIRTQ